MREEYVFFYKNHIGNTSWNFKLEIRELKLRLKMREEYVFFIKKIENGG